jgi:hypothetical protein
MCDIIQQGMGLASDQIWIYNQKRTIPTDNRLYVIVSYSGGMPYSNSVEHSPDGSIQTTSQKIQETITINLLSADTEAIDRIGDLLGCLQSDYAKNQCSTLGLAIASKPASIHDASAAEVTRMLFRTQIELKVLRAYVQTKSVAYYNQFSQSTINEGS